MYFAMGLYGFAVLIGALIVFLAFIIAKIYIWLKWIFKD